VVHSPIYKPPLVVASVLTMSAFFLAVVFDKIKLGSTLGIAGNGLLLIFYFMEARARRRNP